MKDCGRNILSVSYDWNAYSKQSVVFLIVVSDLMGILLGRCVFNSLET